MYQNEARKLNHSEVVEEDKRNKEPANIEAKRKRLEWEEQEAKRKKECKEKGEQRVYYTWKLNNDFLL